MRQRQISLPRRHRRRRRSTAKKDKKQGENVPSWSDRMLLRLLRSFFADEEEEADARSTMSVIKDPAEWCELRGREETSSCRRRRCSDQIPSFNSSDNRAHWVSSSSSSSACLPAFSSLLDRDDQKKNQEARGQHDQKTNDDFISLSFHNSSNRIFTT